VHAPVVPAGSANATTRVFHYKCAKYLQSDGSYTYEADAYNQNGTPVGDTEFDADPDALHSGDAIRATDSFADAGARPPISARGAASARGATTPRNPPDHTRRREPLPAVPPCCVSRSPGLPVGADRGGTVAPLGPHEDDLVRRQWRGVTVAPR
jgi:hypothetical protein